MFLVLKKVKLAMIFIHNNFYWILCYCYTFSKIKKKVLCLQKNMQNDQILTVKHQLFEQNTAPFLIQEEAADCGEVSV